ncbi:MAG: hypothetical protein ABI042_13500 [Verrucomicrobiota bacterium]
MKKNLIITALVAASFTLPSVFAGNSGHKGGTDILHFFVRKTMSNAGVVPEAVGRIDGKRALQGNADNQKLDINLQNLATNATYHLSAIIGDGTNFTEILDFGTNEKGSAKLQYRRMGANGSHGLGHGKTALPAALNPISNIRELAIFDTNAQLVLSADLTAPDKLQYLVKRSLTNDGVETNAAASLRVKGTTDSTQFRLLASGLQSGASYSLVINGNVDETKVAEADGKLNFTNLLVTSSDILDVRTLALWNSTSNSVLSTQLP